MSFTAPSTYASKANTGYEAQFSIGSPLVPVVECKSFQPKPVDVPNIDSTHLLSPNNTEEYVPGMIKPGTVEISGNFIGDTTQLQFNTLAQAQTIFNFQLIASMQRGAKTYTATGEGFLRSYEPGPFENNKMIEFKASIQITGAWSETVA